MIQRLTMNYNPYPGRTLLVNIFDRFREGYKVYSLAYGSLLVEVIEIVSTYKCWAFDNCNIQRMPVNITGL
jgi:hypothetical protein